MKVAAIVQARQGSSRLPGKALIDIYGKPAIQRVIERLQAAKMLDDVIVAMPEGPTDDELVMFCDCNGYTRFRGSEEDVLSRVLEAAKLYDVDIIVEVTADCPLIDWNHVDDMVNLFLSADYDFGSNIYERTYPRGFDLRLFTREALERCNKEVDNPIDRQHVSTWMYLNEKGAGNYKKFTRYAPPSQNRPDIEVTLDTPEDLELIRWLFSFESGGYNLPNGLTCDEVISLIDTYPGQYEKVAKVQRKDYFAELKEYYEGAKKQNEQVQCTDSGCRKTGRKRGRPRKQ